MYRGNYYGPGNKNVSPYRPNDSTCRDTKCGSPDNYCEKRMDDRESGFEKYPLGMCYVPWQRFENLYESEYQAFDRGTIFKDLDLDFLGRSCK
jgi:hypothetical protein